MTPELLARATGAKLSDATAALPHLAEAMASYQIVGATRAPRFLSQIAHESMRLSRLVESLNYSPEGLMATFGPRRITQAQALQYGRGRGRAADQEAIANIVYGGDWGRRNLGNKAPGDGWRYRGRGYKQITGLANYAEATRGLRSVLGVDFVADPDAAAEPRNAAWLAAWFWWSKGLNAFADVGDDETITIRINGGLIGFGERLALLDVAQRAMA